MNEQYLQDLYGWIKGQDPSYEGRYNYNQFKQKMQDESYATQMHGWISSRDETFDQRRPLSSFVQQVKAVNPVIEQPKKKEDTVLPSVGGGSEPTKSEPAPNKLNDNRDFSSLAVKVQDESILTKKPREARPTVSGESTKVVSPKATEFAYQAQKAIETPLPKFVEEQLSAITPNLIGKTEENVVPQLKYQFSPLGFKFEESGAGDYMIATSPSGNSIEISLDITDVEGQKEEANKLNAFLRKGVSTIKNLSTLQNQYTEANKKILSQKELDESLAKINAEEANVMARNAEFAKIQNNLEAEKARLESVPVQQRNNPEYIARVNDFISRADKFSSDFQVFAKDADDLAKRGQQLNKSIGKYTEMKAQQGTWYGSALNAIANKSYYEMAKGLSGVAIDFIGEVISATGLPIMSQEDYEKNFVEQAKKEGIDIPEGQDFISFTSKLNPETLAKIENRVNDAGKKSVRGQVIGDLDKASKMAMESSGVSPEYYRSIEEKFVGGALLGALTSIPAMAGGPVARTVLMGSQVLSSVDAEMANDPAFADISENERYLVKGPIATAVAILENLGLSNLLNQKGYLNSLVLKALGKIGKGASYKTFGEVIKNEIDSAVGRGALTLGAGFLAEAETGALQEVADITAKEIYNMAKEKEMFDTPDSVVQFIEQVGKAGLQEGIGAGVLAVPGSVSAAYTGKGFLGMDDTQFAMFEKMANDSNIQKGFVARLKSRINTGDITAPQGKEILDNYNNSVSLFNSLPDNLDIQGKKEAMNLLKEKRDLERQIDGKDQALTVPQRNRVNEINQQLTKLSEDAIQKQAAGEVPVQPGTGVGQEVAQGEPQAEPQVVAQEGQAQEVIDPLKDVESTTNALANALRDTAGIINDRDSFNTIYDIVREGDLFSDVREKARKEGGGIPQKAIAEKYHESKANGTNPDFVQVVENAFIRQTPTQQQEIDTIEAQRKQALEANKAGLDKPYYLGDTEGPTLGEFINQEYDAKINEVRAKAITPQAQPQMVTPTQQLDLEGEVSLLEQLLAQEETAPTVSAGVSISSDADVQALRNKTQSRSQQATTKQEKDSANARVKIIDTAKRAINTLRSVFPEIDIIIHDDEGSYNAAMSEVNGVTGSKGNLFLETTPDDKTTGRIDINLSKADGRTVAHEIAHAVLLKSFGDNVTLFNDFRTRVSKVLKGDANKQLNDFVDQYIDPATGELLDVNHEEFLAELTGMLEQQETNISVTTMQKVAALINEFVSKITGGKFKPFEDTKNTKDVVDFFNTISGAIREGNEIQQLNSQEPYTSGVALPVTNPNEFVGKKFRSKLDIGDYKFPSGIDILRIADIPIKTLTELVRQYEGRVLIITSDATGYGVDRNGDPILGGFGFASNEKNVSDEIGFASVSTGTVKGTYTAAEKAYGTGKALVLIMIQPPHTTINNSYGAKYIIRGLKEIALSSKEELIKTKDAIKSFIKGSTTIQKELKKTDTNQKRGSEKRLFDFIDSIDETTNLEDAVKEFLNDTTFTIRTVLGQGILFKNKDIRATKSTNYSKIALNNVGYNIYDFLKEYGDNTILTDDLILNNTGGYVVGGFELDVLPKEQRETLINDTQNKGIVHPLFNAKLPGTNHFRLDALYGVQENFAEYAVPDTQISLSKEERDELVRELYKDDNFYKASARELPLEERSYTNLTVPAKTEFKNNYLKPRGLLIEAVPNVSTKVAKGEGFIPKKGAAKQIAKGDFVSRAQLPGNDAQRIVNLGRANGLSDQAISNVLEKRGFTQEAIDTAIGKVEVTENLPASYERMIGQLEGVIEKSLNRNKDKENAMDIAMQNAINYLQGTKVYEEANDVQREAMFRDVRKRFKKREKSAPSAEKIVGKPKKQVTVDEMAALKDQIKLEARAAREAKGDLNKKRKALAAKIIEVRRRGSITSAQARALVNRISKVNLDNPIMVDRLIEYTDKVFDNANYAADMADLRKLQRQARTKKHTSMKDFVDRFTYINPELIPLDRIQDYKEALDFLNNLTPSYARMNEMLPEIESYQVSEEFDAAKTFDGLMSKYENIALNEVGSVEDYVNLIKDINSFKRKAFQLLQNEAITQEEYDNLIDMVGKDQAEIEKRYEKQISELKRGLIAEIKTQRPKTNPEFTKEENDLIKEYLELSNTDLESLSPEDLFVLNDLLDNISNGEIDYYRFKNVVSKAANNKAGVEVGKQLKGSKLSLGSAKLREEMAKFESAFWEGLLGLGRATSGPLQKFVISPFNRAIGSYEKFIREGFNDFLKLKKKYKIDDKGMNKIGMLTTYLQEYMAQFDPNNNGVKDIGKRDWFKEILASETMRDDYSPKELKIIEEIHKSLPKDKDGNVDPKSVYDSYIANDGKFFTKNEKGFFDAVMEWKKNNSTSKQKAANEMSGNAFKEIPFHMLRSRYSGQTSQITPATSGDNGMVRIKAGTGKERASEAVGAINTNFEKLFIKGLEQTGRDYFLSKTLKDINNVLASAKKELAGDKDPLVKAISYTLSDALAYEFSDTASQNLLKRLVQARAAMTLFDPIRAGVEFTSTLLSFGLRARTLSGYKNLFGSQGDMRNLLEFTDSPLRLRQNINNAIDINDGRIEPQGMLMKWTTFLSGLPERTMMVTSWMPTFTSEFKNITGEKFDMKKFNDSSAYREKYGKAIKEASAVADAQTEKIIGPTTKAGQRREIAIFPGKTVGRDTVSGQILGFFSNYPYREVTEFVNGFREAGEVLKKGDTVDALSQLQKPLGISLNVAAYGFLSSVVYASRLILLGDDDEEERGEQLLEELMTSKGFIEETSANAAALAASKYAGGGRATLQLLGTLGMMMTDDEETKATIKKMLKGSVYVDPLPTQKLSGYGTADKVNTAIVKYIPQFVVLSNIIIDGMGGLNELKAIYDKVDSKGIDALTKDEELKVLALSVVFTGTQLFLNYRGTSLPSYNNLKAGMKTVKEEAGVADISSGKVPAKKSSGGGGGAKTKPINKTDLKRYFPEQYNQLYGEGSPTYEIEQEVKAFEKEQREFKKNIKDQIYGVKD
jgi:hypothetical protein